MVKLIMQYPNFKNSPLYDGTKHEIIAENCVRYSSTNIYIVTYTDKKVNMRLRGLFNQGSTNITYIPLVDQTGINDLYKTWATKSQNMTVDELFANDKSIGHTKHFQNIDEFFDELRVRLGLNEGTTLDRLSKSLEDGERKIKESVPSRPSSLTEGFFSSFDTTPDGPDSSDNVYYYQGYRMDGNKKGPMGMPDSSYWYARGNAPYGTRGLGGPGGPRPGGPRPHGPRPGGPHGGPPPGPPPEGGPGRHR